MFDTRPFERVTSLTARAGGVQQVFDGDTDGGLPGFVPVTEVP